MKRILNILFVGLLLTSYLHTEENPFKFDGILGQPVSNINNMNDMAKAFIPYNPTVVEIGAYKGNGTLGLAYAYPYGRVFAFEPNPSAFSALKEKMQPFTHVYPINLAVHSRNGSANLYFDTDNDEMRASLLKTANQRIMKGEGKHISVQCVNLDEWCKSNDVNRIDFLRLDAGGLEYQILDSAPRILETVLVITTKTYFHKPRKSIVSYFLLKSYLEMRGFELLSHWYQEGIEGEAIFVRKFLYDSIFR